jgi:hypothetical protein
MDLLGMTDSDFDPGRACGAMDIDQLFEVVVEIFNPLSVDRIKDVLRNWIR